jgi:hypothetical protein
VQVLHHHHRNLQLAAVPDMNTSAQIVIGWPDSKQGLRRRVAEREDQRRPEQFDLMSQMTAA